MSIYLIFNATTQNVYRMLFCLILLMRVHGFFSYWKNKMRYKTCRSKCESEMKTGDVVILAHKNTVSEDKYYYRLRFV